jgi:hypothetical protein
LVRFWTKISAETKRLNDTEIETEMHTETEISAETNTETESFQSLISNVEKILDSLKNYISTNLNKVYAIKSQFVSIFIFALIESLDLDSFKKLVLTLRTILISIALNCRDPQAYFLIISKKITIFKKN